MKSSKYNTQKFINCVLFFAKKTDPKKLGILKLNKLLYYIDFGHYKKYGRPILGDVYIRMDHGPVPSFSYNLFNAAFRDKNDDPDSNELRKCVEIKPDRVKDFKINTIYPKNIDFDASLFSESELKIMETVALAYFSKSGTAMSKETHKDDTPWSKTPAMQPVDYDLILDKNSISKDYINYWKEEEKILDSFPCK
jgi:uncharacterized phage-associated protein